MANRVVGGLVDSIMITALYSCVTLATVFAICFAYEPNQPPGSKAPRQANQPQAAGEANGRAAIPPADTVLLVDVLHYVSIEEQDAILDRAAAAVRPGGRLLVREADTERGLRSLATLLSPTYGSGVVLGFDLLRDREAIRERTELLGHRTRLYEDLTGEENLRFACAMFGLDRAGIPGALERVGLRTVARELVRGYSQGMRQRVAVARAILRRPQLLLLDEPYAGLDTEARGVVDEVVLETNGRGGTVVLATHEPTRGGFAGRTLFMEAGRLLPEAHPAMEEVRA